MAKTLCSHCALCGDEQEKAVFFTPCTVELSNAKGPFVAVQILFKSNASLPSELVNMIL